MAKIPKGRYDFQKMQAGAGNSGEYQKPFEEKQARLAEIEGLELKGDFEQRRSRWGKSGNKAACFECGYADHFKAEFPIWIKKTEKWQQEGKPGNERERKGRRKEKINHVCMSRRGRNGPKRRRDTGERSERFIQTYKFSKCLRGQWMGKKERIERKNVLALSTQVLMVEVYVVSRGRIDTRNAYEVFTQKQSYLRK